MLLGYVSNRRALLLFLATLEAQLAFDFYAKRRLAFENPRNNGCSRAHRQPFLGTLERGAAPLLRMASRRTTSLLLLPKSLLSPSVRQPRKPRRWFQAVSHSRGRRWEEALLYPARLSSGVGGGGVSARALLTDMCVLLSFRVRTGAEGKMSYTSIPLTMPTYPSGARRIGSGAGYASKSGSGAAPPSPSPAVVEEHQREV